jgi:hypothetical protein
MPLASLSLDTLSLIDEDFWPRRSTIIDDSNRAYFRTRTETERQGIEDFMLEVLKDRVTDSVTRTNLIGDFAQLGRSDLKPFSE